MEEDEKEKTETECATLDVTYPLENIFKAINDVSGGLTCEFLHMILIFKVLHITSFRYNALPFKSRDISTIVNNMRWNMSFEAR